MRFTKIVALAGLVGAFAIAAAGAAQAAPFDCSFLTDSGQIVQGKNATTSSTEFVDVAGSEVTFGNFSPCFRVEVYGKVNALAPQAMRVRVSLDPVTDDTRATSDVIAPPDTDFYASSNGSDGLAAVFYVRKAATGDGRTLRLQFMSVKGGAVKLDTWTVVVRSGIT